MFPDAVSKKVVRFCLKGALASFESFLPYPKKVEQFYLKLLRAY